MDHAAGKLGTDGATIGHKIWRSFQDHVTLRCRGLLVVETRLKIASRRPRLKPNGEGALTQLSWLTHHEPETTKWWLWAKLAFYRNSCGFEVFFFFLHEFGNLLFPDCSLVVLVIARRWAIDSVHLMRNKGSPTVLTAFLNLHIVLHSLVNFRLLKCLTASHHVSWCLTLFPQCHFGLFSQRLTLMSLMLFRCEFDFAFYTRGTNAIQS